MDPTEETPEAALPDTQELLGALLAKLGGWLEGLVAALPNILVALVLILVAWFVSRLFQKWSEAAFQRVAHNAQLAGLVGVLVRLVVFFGGVFVALGVLQLDKTVTSLLAGVGILGIALGFAAQDTAANLISGVIMAVQRPFHVNDMIETNGYTGIVTKVDLRATHVRKMSGEAVLIPNKDVFGNAIVNYVQNGTRRVELEVGVSYGDDLDKVLEVLHDTIKDLPNQDEKRDVDIFFTEFGGSSIDLLVRFWITNPAQSAWLKARSQAILKISKAFGANGITIPFPIRTLDFGIEGGERLDETLMRLPRNPFQGDTAQNAPDSESQSSPASPAGDTPTS